MPLTPVTSSGSLTSCRCSMKEALCVRCMTFRSSPVMKLSTQSTGQPRRRSRSHRCDPRKPAPPATNTEPDCCISLAIGHSSYVVGLARIPARHAGTEIRKLFRVERRTGMVGTYAARLGREAESHRHLEFLQGTHLAVEPAERSRTQAVRPAQAGAQVFDAQPPQPLHRVIQPVVLEMEPLA